MTRLTIFGTVDRIHEEERWAVTVVYNGSVRPQGGARRPVKCHFVAFSGLVRRLSWMSNRMQQENSHEKNIIF